MIAEKLLLIQKKLGQSGLAKDQTGSGINYNYRGIDQLYNVLSPLLCEAGVVVLPRMIDRRHSSFSTKSGAVFQHVAVKMSYEFIDTTETEKSSVTIETFGEGADSLDKATSKAMTAAYKYAMIQLFAIPIVGRDDPDNSGLGNDQVVEPLTDVQLAGLKQMVKEIDEIKTEPMDVAGFVKWLCSNDSIESLEDIPQSQATRAVNALAAIKTKAERESKKESNDAKNKSE